METNKNTRTTAANGFYRFKSLETALSFRNHATKIMMVVRDEESGRFLVMLPAVYERDFYGIESL